MYSKSIREVLDSYNVTMTKGLDAKKHAALYRQYGPNVLPEPVKDSVFKKFLLQFKDFMIYTLIGAAAISFAVSYIEGKPDYVEPSIILFIIIINALIGVVQEVRAENSINALKKICAPTATVLRNGSWSKYPAKELVPGDIILLETGALIPADARIIQCENLKTDESSLTGESLPIDKNTDVLPPKTAIGDRTNMVYSGSVVCFGHGTAVVTATGSKTELGSIAGMLISAASPDTPLTKRLEKTGRALSIAALIICISVFVTGVIKHRPILEMFMTAVSLAVAAIPEGLPAIVTIMLAKGVTRMSARKAIVKKLPAVETLGSTTVICSDKTGTLTENKMKVVSVSNFTQILAPSDSSYNMILEYASLCNNSIIQKKEIIGEPTENAILTAASSVSNIVSLRNTYTRIAENAFTSKRKMMSTLHKCPSKDNLLMICKGAPDMLLPLCSHYYDNILTSRIREKILTLNNRFASRGLRVIAVAYKNVTAKNEFTENDLSFLGLIAMVDPPRKEAYDAVKQCRLAGIRPVMITGDQPATATYIAKELGIAGNNAEVITGKELDEMTDEMLQNNLHRYNVYSRVTPEHKLRLVKAFQKQGEIVAMTGDGVNDAPALKAADIGCAMGMNGTDVARNASDIILEDDNFATITSAIREGRTIYSNIKKAIHFLISCNIGEILTIFMAIILGFASPLCPVQLLWVNLVTDSFPALALGVEPPDKSIMKRPPLSPSKGLFSDGLGFKIALEGMLIGSLALVAYAFGIRYGYKTASTMCFAVLGLSQIAHSFNSKSDISLGKTGIFNNPKLILSAFLCIILQTIVICVPSLNAIFQTSYLTFNQWSMVAFLSLLPIPFVELQKWVNGR